MKLSKTEQKILDQVHASVKLGALAGLGTSPNNTNFYEPAHRFVKRLHDKGAIVWVAWNKKYGAGWATPEVAARFTADTQWDFIEAVTGTITR